MASLRFVVSWENFGVHARAQPLPSPCTLNCVGLPSCENTRREPLEYMTSTPIITRIRDADTAATPWRLQKKQYAAWRLG